jgi:hypothetical protein
MSYLNIDLWHPNSLLDTDRSAHPLLTVSWKYSHGPSVRLERADMDTHASILRAHYQQTLSSFIRCYITKDPWYFSIMYRVEKNNKIQTLTKVLGISYAGDIAVLCLTGLLVVKTMKQETTVLEFKADSWK